MKETVKSDIPAFRMFGNLYFVGCRKVSVHILKTEVGLVMIDTGYPDMYEQILNSMHTLGLDERDICAIFHSHGHIDHFGCTTKFKTISGAKTYISRIDNEIVNGTYDLSWAAELNIPKEDPFNCDYLVEDEDIFTFGSTSIRCRLTPGHTNGVLSFFIPLHENGKSIVAAMHGGIGTNSMRASFLQKYGLSFDCREKFREGLQTLASEKVDLVLGNHPDQNETEKKRDALLAGGTILSPNEWQSFLLHCEQRLDNLIASEQQSI